MKILITGICGFVGATLARTLPKLLTGVEITGVDNLMRDGAHLNRTALKDQGIAVHHGDLRNPEDLTNLPRADWIIDAAACPAVMAGVDGRVGSRQLLGHNLLGTINLLELCRDRGSALAIISTSRVYSIAGLAAIPLEAQANRYAPAPAAASPGLSSAGISEDFATTPPISLYGASKLASELLAMEYAAAFGFPLIINRCGVLAGAGQFARADQGIFAYWVHASRERQALKFIGFDGAGRQVRDCLHPRDLARLLARQIQSPASGAVTPLNVSGGQENSASLAELDDWCRRRFGTPPATPHPITRPFDVPWLILDSARARRQWNWAPELRMEDILVEIAEYADKNPHWLAQT